MGQSKSWQTIHLAYLAQGAQVAYLAKSIRLDFHVGDPFKILSNFNPKPLAIPIDIE